MIVPWQKPFRGTPINPAHPMARGLAAAYPFNEATATVNFYERSQRETNKSAAVRSGTTYYQCVESAG